MSPLFLILVGIVFLYIGGEALVGGARQLARRFGLTPLVIGLTVVAFGTSAPELATTLAAVLEGSPEVGVGNVVGSNIANLALVLALCALLYPIRTTVRFLRREMPFMLFASMLLMVFVIGGWINRLEGLISIALLVGFIAYLLRREEPGGAEEELEAELRGGPKPIWLSSAMVIVGLALLVGGAHYLVEGAVILARAAGVSERVIGLTIVAVGTSLPELASSLVAAWRRQGDIVLGNLVGSNIFNILCILGITATVQPIPITAAGTWLDLGVMLAVSVLVWPLLATGLVLKRWEGAVLLAAYIAYIASLFVIG